MKCEGGRVIFSRFSLKKENTKINENALRSFFFLSKRLKICVIIIAMMCGDVCRKKEAPRRKQRFIALSALFLSCSSALDDKTF